MLNVAQFVGLCGILFVTADLVIGKCSIDYYWVDYTGEIPENAVRAGLDQKFQPVYVGQAYVQNKGVSAVGIQPGSSFVEYPSYRLSFTTKDFVKILVSPNKHKLKWTPTNSSSYNLITEDIVIGGLENGCYTNIGRINYQGVIVGKVLACDITKPIVLSFPYAKTEQNSATYEILTYDCSDNGGCKEL